MFGRNTGLVLTIPKYLLTYNLLHDPHIPVTEA